MSFLNSVECPTLRTGCSYPEKISLDGSLQHCEQDKPRHLVLAH